MSAEDIEVKSSVGNVFADLEHPEAELHLVKAQLVSGIDAIIRKRKLTQIAAGQLLGLSQPDVSRLLRGDFRDFSVERLFRLLTSLGRDVEIVIRRPRTKRHGRLNVAAA
jgi:predicted XRE-type DNA-binding protein